MIAPAHLGKLGRAAIDEYSPQFPLRLMNQNFGLILHLARIKDAHMAVTEAAYEASKPALPTEGDEDFSAMVRYMERLNVGSNSARSVLDGRQPASR